MRARADWSVTDEMTSPTEPRDVLRIALVGAGRVGTAVALLLQQRGHEIVGVGSRNEDSRREAARRLGSPTCDLRSDLPRADLILIGASDVAIEEVARAIAPQVAPGTYVCHFAGSLGVEPLREVAGARHLATHPVQACPDVDTAVRRLPGSAWGVTAAGEDVAWAESLVARDLEGTPVRVAERDRPIWHAASVTVSNGIAALLASGEAMLGSIGISDAGPVLDPLASGTVANAREGGGGAATLTGPVVRSESFVVERHLEELRRRDPSLADGYVSIAATIVRAAYTSGRLDRQAADAMLSKLRSP